VEVIVAVLEVGFETICHRFSKLGISPPKMVGLYSLGMSVTTTFSAGARFYVLIWTSTSDSDTIALPGVLLRATGSSMQENLNRITFGSHTELCSKFWVSP
jgi:hypothetical protein